MADMRQSAETRTLEGGRRARGRGDPVARVGKPGRLEAVVVPAKAGTQSAEWETRTLRGGRRPREGGDPVSLRTLDKYFCVYMLASQRNGTLYVGVTSTLAQRVWQHKGGFVDGFTKKYQTNLLVWFEQHDCAGSAITREKQIKKWNRAWKTRLIEKTNPYWNDLYLEIAS